MKSQLPALKRKTQKLLRGHQAFVVLLFVLFVLMGVFLRINTLSNQPLDTTYLNQESSKLKSVRFNEDAIEQIKLLKESNVADPGTQLPLNRQNPFNE
jgi:hypothetical protein